MKNYRLESRAICFALLFALLSLFPDRLAQSQTEPFLNRFRGSWQGEGKAFGMAASLHLKWEWVLGDKFLRLSLRNTMRAASGQTQVFEGHAYYQPIGESKYAAEWFDSRGIAFPIKAQAAGDALIAFWGTPEQEQGKSSYRIVESGKMEVVDSVRQKDGTWKEFGRFVVTRE
jgi:hypothetical protein